jgi:hypothetical protein
MECKLPVLKEIKTANFNFEDPVLMVAIVPGTILATDLQLTHLLKLMTEN